MTIVIERLLKVLDVASSNLQINLGKLNQLRLPS
jgi:hypothetical protein